MYQEQIIYELANRVTTTAKLADVCIRGKPESEAMALLKRVFPQENPFVKEGAIHTTWVSLRLSGAKRVEEVEVDELTAEWAQPVKVTE